MVLVEGETGRSILIPDFDLLLADSVSVGLNSREDSGGSELGSPPPSRDDWKDSLTDSKSAWQTQKDRDDLPDLAVEAETLFKLERGTCPRNSLKEGILALAAG
jgi:hypothetical protein